MKPILARSLLLAACASWGTPAVAQWASTPYNPSRPVEADGFLVAHEDAGGRIQVFSAAAQTWNQLPSPTGSWILGTGDWTVLVREPTAYRAYSARRNASAYVSTATAAKISPRVHDDVALVVTQETGFPPKAHGYSAVKNAWSTIELDEWPDADDISISSFVIGIRDANAYHGFAARTGAWASLPVTVPGDEPIARGNVLSVNLTDLATGLGVPHGAAFSGVRGNWAVSPRYVTWMSTDVFPDHNVAYTRAELDPAQLQYVGCAYSAYEGAWFSSSVVRSTSETTLLDLRDNLVVLRDESGFEAFGSEPGSWAWLPGSWGPAVWANSFVAARDASNTHLAAFSGVCSGTWSVQPVSGFPSTAGSGDHSGLFRAGNLLHAYSPALHAWASPLAFSSSAVITNADAVCDVRDTLFVGCAARKGAWVLGPLVPAASFTRRYEGSLIAHQQTSGAGAGNIYVFDERAGIWPAPFNPGGVGTLTLGRNLLVSEVLEAPAPIRAYSVQRGDWTAPAGFAPPVATSPRAEDNVTWVVDGSGNLWAFGSPNQGHVHHDWPNGTEYHTSGTAPYGNTAFVAHAIRANPGDLVWANVGLKGLQPPLVIPGIGGALCLDPTLMFSLGFWGAVDGDSMLEQLLYFYSPLPACVELRFQPLIFDVATLSFEWGHRCDPAWFF